MATEKQIENSILEYLNTSKMGFFFKVNTMGVWDSAKKCYRKTSKWVIPGTADIIGITTTGQFVAIEIKTKATRKRLTDNQKQFLSAIKINGGLCGVATNIEEAVAIVIGEMKMQ